MIFGNDHARTVSRAAVNGRGEQGDRMEQTGQRNADVPWCQFDPKEYLGANYTDVGVEDRQVMEVVRDFFCEQFAGNGSTRLRGIDVGTGVNMYPALSMMPFCESITLYEHAVTNLEWLVEQASTGWPSWSRVWSRFWSVLRTAPRYAGLDEHPRRALTRRVEVVSGNVFTLDPTTSQWDIGTMFFVAESITTEHIEFEAAVHSFLQALRPGAPFALACMENSVGYKVAGVEFPAVSVNRTEVRDCLRGRATNVTVHRVDGRGSRLREGYSGMIVACGRSLGARSAPVTVDGTPTRRVG